MWWYRPHNGSFDKSLENIKTFKTKKDMFDYIVETENAVFKDTLTYVDLSIDKKRIDDKRIGWHNTRYVLTRRYCGTKTLQCIGYCNYGRMKSR